LLALGAIVLPGGPVAAQQLGTAFTYQGQLKEGNAPVDAACDFKFTLWSDPTSIASADQVGPTLTFGGGASFLPPIDVVDGLFTVQLDFGADAFDGNQRWMEIGVHCPAAPPGTGFEYTTLTPRTPVTAAPYALYALQAAGGADGHWAANGDDIYSTNANNVGIGTTEPSASLHVTNSGGKTAVLAETPWIGVYGKHASTSGSFPGVWGETDSLVANATGLRGYVTSTTPGSGSVGVLGLNKGTGGAGMGVKGQQDGSGWGVYGTTPNGTGVYGNATGNSGTNYGVRGASASPSGYGGYFTNTSSDGTALYAQSAGSGRDDATLQVHNTQASAGMAAYMTSVGSWATAHLQNNGSGEVLWLARDNTDAPFIVAYNEETGRRVFTVNQNGWTAVTVLQITGGADLSEQFQVGKTDGEPQPGMVVSIDPANPGELVVSRTAYDRTVAGVISGAGGVKPGMLMAQEDSITDGDHPVALTGRVYVWCDASEHPIEPGDLLTTSDLPGHAMKVIDHAKAQGAIIGKAMTRLAEGKGLVLVLISLQ
jgi:hypothetical protein